MILEAPILFCTTFQFFPLYREVKTSKDQGSFEDFVECLKLYDKQENGTMMLGELEHILLSLGRLTTIFYVLVFPDILTL